MMTTKKRSPATLAFIARANNSAHSRAELAKELARDAKPAPAKSSPASGKKTLTIRFHECEHSGDLDHYAHDVGASGGRIVSESLNEEAETGTLTVEVDDVDAFKAKFAKTDSHDFSSLAPF